MGDEHKVVPADTVDSLRGRRKGDPQQKVGRTNPIGRLAVKISRIIYFCVLPLVPARLLVNQIMQLKTLDFSMACQETANLYKSDKDDYDISISFFRVYR